MNNTRVGKTVRLAPAGWNEVAKIAAREDRSIAETVRLLIKYAVRTMPKGWTGT